jgi:glutaconate CoA-transferase subunit A
MSKVVPLRDALARVEDGSHLALTGFAITRNAVSAALELVRAGRKHLSLTQVIVGVETDLLVGAGCVDRLVYSGGSLDRFGLVYAINRAISSGELAIEEYSTLSLTLRLAAGGLGLPFVPTRSMLGSQLLDRLRETGEVVEQADPFTGAPVLVMSPVRPDVAVVHADSCDEEGNATISGPRWSIRETVLAARSVVVTTERVVMRGTIPPERVVVPGAVVDAVVEAPGGARPTSMPGHYDYDRQWMQEHVAASREGGAAFERYLDAQLSRLQGGAS